MELSDGGTESLDTKNIVLATGSEVTPLPPVPVDNAAGKIVDSTGALEIASIPQTMAVVGGGVIGLEMGSVWSRLGTDVTVIEFMDRLCPSMDAEVTKKFQTILKKQGFKFQLKTKVMESRLEDDGVVLKTEASKGGKEKEAKYDVVLVATGRRAYTDGLGLEALGIQPVAHSSLIPESTVGAPVLPVHQALNFLTLTSSPSPSSVVPSSA